MANIRGIRNELDADPLGRDYGTMAAQKVADSLNARDRQRLVPISSVRIMQYLIDHDLWLPIKRGADDAAEKARDGLAMFETFRMDEPDIAASMGGMLNTLIAAGYITSDDKAAIQALGVQMQSQAEELNLLGRSPEIGFAHVQQARAL